MRPSKFDGQPIPRPAVFSDDRAHRYVLWREWDELFGGRFCAFICLNPSTADETNDDPTVRRCIGFAQRWGFGSFVMLNLFAFRATLPDDMRKAADPIGPDNDDWILRVTAEAGMVVAAWGNHGAFMDRAAQVRAMLKGKLYYLEQNADGSPRHPLYLAGNTVPRLYDPTMVPGQGLPGAEWRKP